jgi:hypothetical protein
MRMIMGKYEKLEEKIVWARAEINRLSSDVFKLKDADRELSKRIDRLEPKQTKEIVIFEAHRKNVHEGFRIEHKCYCGEDFVLYVGCKNKCFRCNRLYSLCLENGIYRLKLTEPYPKCVNDKCIEWNYIHNTQCEKYGTQNIDRLTKCKCYIGE